MKQIQPRVFRKGSLVIIYIVVRYSCGHYRLVVLNNGKRTEYGRLTRRQIEAVANIDCKDVFGLKH